MKWTELTSAGWRCAVNDPPDKTGDYLCVVDGQLVITRTYSIEYGWDDEVTHWRLELPEPPEADDELD